MENELLVKNETEYTYERYLKLNQFNMYTKQKVTLIVLIISVIVIFLCGIFMLVIGSYDRAIFYIALALVFSALYVFLPSIQTKKIFKSDNLLKSNIKNTFEFYNDRIDISNKTSNSKLDYQDIYKVYERKEAFYIYLNRIQVLIVSKDCFIMGDAEKLRNLLKEKVGKDYVNKI